MTTNLQNCCKEEKNIEVLCLHSHDVCDAYNIFFDDIHATKKIQYDGKLNG